jgi:hypothetical protein
MHGHMNVSYEYEVKKNTVSQWSTVINRMYIILQFNAKKVVLDCKII